MDGKSNKHMCDKHMCEADQTLLHVWKIKYLLPQEKPHTETSPQYLLLNSQLMIWTYKDSGSMMMSFQEN